MPETLRVSMSYPRPDSTQGIFWLGRIVMKDEEMLVTFTGRW